MAPGGFVAAELPQLRPRHCSGDMLWHRDLTDGRCLPAAAPPPCCGMQASRDHTLSMSMSADPVLRARLTLMCRAATGIRTNPAQEALCSHRRSCKWHQIMLLKQPDAWRVEGQGRTSGLVKAGDSSSSASAMAIGTQRAMSSAAARASRTSAQSTQRSTFVSARGSPTRLHRNRHSSILCSGASGLKEGRFADCLTLLIWRSDITQTQHSTAHCSAPIPCPRGTSSFADAAFSALTLAHRTLQPYPSCQNQRAFYLLKTEQTVLI